MSTATEQIRAADQARQFPTNTCPASRHAQQMAEAMVKGEPYPMMEEERSHCGESILSVVTSLYKVRTERDALAQRLEAAEKDAGRWRWLKPTYTAANFHPESLDLGNKGVVLMFVAPDEMIVSSDLDEMADDAIRALSNRDST